MSPELVSPFVAQIIKERSDKYGPPDTSYYHLANIWTQLLENHYGMKLEHAIPPRVAALMMVAVKTLRATSSPALDNHVDLAAFNQFAAEF
ncbi:MAG TPA: DUF6378 domain-containing protein, partial [Nitrospiraceae bacterium]|nr:DUF6378 domain-containing protein [Nitrospiraceae bacterium]